MEGKLQVHDREINKLFGHMISSCSHKRKTHYVSEMLKTLEKYTNENKLEIYTDKTKAMIFNKTGRLMRRAFHINGVQLENVCT